MAAELAYLALSLFWLRGGADEVDALLGSRRNNEHEVITSMKTEFMQARSCPTPQGALAAFRCAPLWRQRAGKKLCMRGFWHEQSYRLTVEMHFMLENCTACVICKATWRLQIRARPIRCHQK